MKFDKRLLILVLTFMVILSGMWYSNKKPYDMPAFETKPVAVGAKADMTLLPQAVVSNAFISIETLKEAKNNEDFKTESSVSEQNAEGLININLADAAELDALPGIGEVLAKAIVTYRDENGPFQSINEIMEVKGIGEKKFEKLKDSITVTN